MTFAGATASAEGDASSSIAEMAGKLTRSKRKEVIRISVGEIPAIASGVTGRSSHLDDFPSPVPRIGNISTCPDTLIFLAPLLMLFS